MKASPILLLTLLSNFSPMVEVNACCRAFNAECNACLQDLSIQEYCEKTGAEDGINGCENFRPGGEGSDTGDGSTVNKICCRTATAECLSCSAGLNVKEYCEKTGSA